MKHNFYDSADLSYIRIRVEESGEVWNKSQMK